jgi:hypothetical protein
VLVAFFYPKTLKIREHEKIKKKWRPYFQILNDALTPLKFMPSMVKKFMSLYNSQPNGIAESFVETIEKRLFLHL